MGNGFQMASLPEGFELDKKPTGLPEGFVIDEVVEQEDPRDFIGGLETAATVGSGIIAEPVAGLLGLANLAFTQDPARAAEMVESVRGGLTYQPRTPEGKETLESVSETLAPVGEALEDAEKFLGEGVLELTGSPELAAIAHTIPTATLEAIGFKGARGLKRGSDLPSPKKVLENAPDISAIKETARGIYRQLDESGVRVDQDQFLDLVGDIQKDAKKLGADQTLTPKSNAAIKRIDTEIGEDLTVGEVDQLRKIAKIAADDVDNLGKPTADAAIGSMMIEKIENFMDKQPTTDKTAGAQYRQARDLWSRVKKTEIIDEAFTKAENQASGFENGLRTQFRSILNSPKKRKSFTKDELNAMRRVVQGGALENTFKLLGKFGFSEGQRVNALLPALGVGAGVTAGGPIGGVLVPAIGQVSLNLSQKLTRKNAQMVKDITRAGKNANDIVKAYFKNVPISERSAMDIQQLLLNKDVTPADIRQMKGLTNAESKLIKDAKFLYNQVQSAVQSGALVAEPALEAVEEEDGTPNS